MHDILEFLNLFLYRGYFIFLHIQRAVSNLIDASSITIRREYVKTLLWLSQGRFLLLTDDYIRFHPIQFQKITFSHKII